MPSITKYVIAKPLALAVLDVHLQQHIVLSNWQTLGNTIITHEQSYLGVPHRLESSVLQN